MNKKRRVYGEHLTPTEVFENFILPEIEDKIYNYIWVDLFAGEGNLVLPILELIPEKDRIDFFRKHIFLFDIQKEMVERAIENTAKYGIPKDIAEKNIIQRDTIKDYPEFLLNLELPIYHITNPPYLHKSFISRYEETKKYLECFKGENKRYQDLYHLALINDLKHRIEKMIYIIPSNFLFGNISTKKIRYDLLQYYYIKKAIILEKQIFNYTGVNVIVSFFERKSKPKHETISFEGIKINREVKKRTYILEPNNYYKAGKEFEEFVNNYQAIKPIFIKYYLDIEEVEKNKGDYEIEVIDANSYTRTGYKKKKIYVNREMYEKIKSNILFVKSIDTGNMNGRAGLYKIKDIFGVDGILVTTDRYRSHPIQIFFNPTLTEEEQILLRDYFNTVLEYFREKTDSEFLTTYKYSNSQYTRKTLGLSQTRKLIKTFPWLSLNDEEKDIFKKLIESKNIEEIISFIKNKNKKE
ncbi:MAG: N-6 DNA methylase [Fervidicoccaceae archaeon]